MGAHQVPRNNIYIEVCNKSGSLVSFATYPGQELIILRNWQKKIYLIVALSLPLSAGSVQANFMDRIQQVFSGYRIEKLAPYAPFDESVIIHFHQPLDHNNPDGPGFEQRIFISAAEKFSPVLFETEGYEVFRTKPNELLELTGFNQVIVEHRFFGTSCPDSLNWNYLDLEQAANDYHRIIPFIQELFSGAPVITTGRSKGGQTALYYRYRYPDDVSGTVAFVAPVNQAQADQRLHDFFINVGDESTRNSITAFQQSCLERKEQLIPYLRRHALEKNYTFAIGLDKTLEYAILEYPFSLWQWSDEGIPIPGASVSDSVLFEHLSSAVGFYLYCDEGITYYAPMMYQGSTELGYYNFNMEGIGSYFTDHPAPSNFDLAPPEVEVKWNPEPMRNLIDYLANRAERVITVYGALDPWGASRPQIKRSESNLQFVLPGANHSAGISRLNDQQKIEVKALLEKWTSDGRAGGN
jgi:hypothetical protein